MSARRLLAGARALADAEPLGRPIEGEAEFGFSGADFQRVRELIHRLGGGRGHRTCSGTPEQIADTIERWFDAGAADGFNIMPVVLPSGLEDFVDHVVPLLRARVLLREEYSGRTLREHYGLVRPTSQFAARSGSAATQ